MDESGAKRTRVACETCRRKKIKCSGEKPCSNCIQSKETECKYIEKVRRKPKEKTKVRKRVTNAKAIQFMEDRLVRLEGFISNISNRLDTMAGGTVSHNGGNTTAITTNGSSVASFNEEEEDDSEDEEDEDDDDDEDDDEEDEEDDDVVEKTTKPLTANTLYDRDLSREGAELYGSLECDPANEADKYDILGQFDQMQDKQEHFTMNIKDHYFESHSFFSVFSVKSMEWISQNLAPEKKYVVKQFTNFPFFFISRCKKMIKKVIDPVIITPENRKTLLERPLLEDREYMLGLFDQSLCFLAQFDFVIPIKQVRKLFEIYYADRKLNSAQYLMVCGFSIILIDLKLDKNAENIRGPDDKIMDPKVAGRYKGGELVSLRDRLVDSALLYYHRISLVGDGLLPIQSILILILSMACDLNADIEYMMLAVAVRFAQEMGLHRPESYNNLNAKEAWLRRRVWHVCSSLDIELSFRNGKPPVLSPLELNRTTKGEMKVIVQELELHGIDHLSIDNVYYDTKSQTYQFSPDVMIDCYRNGNFQVVLHYSNYLLSRVRVKSYHKLFLSVGNLRTVENLEKLLDELNDDSRKICEGMMNELRPKFYDDPAFFSGVDDLDLNTREQLIKTHMIFFFNLLLTNRVPFMIDTSDDSTKINEYRALHVKSARTLLHLGLIMNHEKLTKLTMGGICFYPFAAFLMLSSVCMNHPTNPETQGDLALLCRLSDKFFDEKNIKKRPSAGITKFTMSSIIMKLFVEVVYAIVESKSKQKFELSAVHHKQMQALVKHAPELFVTRTANGFNSFFHSSTDEKEVLGTSDTGSSNFVNDAHNIRSDFRKPSHNRSPVDVDGGTPVAYQANSPSYNPSLANLMHPDNPASSTNDIQYASGGMPLDRYGVQQPMTENAPINSTDSTSGSNPSPEFLNNAQSFDFDDDSLSNLVNFQMNQLPNFFFDNNLGF